MKALFALLAALILAVAPPMLPNRSAMPGSPAQTRKGRLLPSTPLPTLAERQPQDQGVPYPEFLDYEREIEGKLYLFAYLEYVGADFTADMKRMAADPETQRWWKETDPCQSPLPDAAAAGKIWADTQEVYHLR